MDFLSGELELLVVSYGALEIAMELLDPSETDDRLKSLLQLTQQFVLIFASRTPIDNEVLFTPSAVDHW